MIRSIAVLLVLLASAACTGSPPPTATALPKPGVAAPPAGGGGADKPAAESPRARAVAEARPVIERAVAGVRRDEALSLLESASTIADEQQRYEAYLGVWQYLRLIYLQEGRTAEQKAALDAVEAIARTFPQYRADQFEVEKRA